MDIQPDQQRRRQRLPDVDVLVVDRVFLTLIVSVWNRSVSEGCTKVTQPIPGADLGPASSFENFGLPKRNALTTPHGQDSLPSALHDNTISAQAQSLATSLAMPSVRLAAPALSCGPSNDAKRDEGVATHQDTREESGIHGRAVEDIEVPRGCDASLTHSSTLDVALAQRKDQETDRELLSVGPASVVGNQVSGPSQEEPMELEVFDDDSNDERQDEVVASHARVECDAVDKDTEDAGARGDGVSTADQEMRRAYGVDLRDAPNDELLLRIVVQERGAFDKFTRRRKLAWDSMTRAFVAAGGVGIQDRTGVTKRIAMLTLVLYERPHLLSESLRALLLEFHERNCAASFAVRLGGPFLKTLRTHAQANRAGSATVPHQTNTHWARRAAPKAGCGRRAPDAAYDEAPTFRGRHQQQRTRGGVEEGHWRVQFARQMRRACAEPLENSISAAWRVRTATTALVDPTHRYHAYLTPALRAMLLEFQLFDPSTPSSPLNVAEKNTIFMRIVLAKRPFDTQGDAQDKVWSDVDDAFVATSGCLFHLRCGAQNHVTTLTKQFLEFPHRLPRVLREMVAEYRDLRSRAASQNRRDGDSSTRLEASRVEAVALTVVPRAVSRMVNRASDTTNGATSRPSESHGRGQRVAKNQQSRSADVVAANPEQELGEMVAEIRRVTRERGVGPVPTTAATDPPSIMEAPSKPQAAQANHEGASPVRTSPCLQTVAAISSGFEKESSPATPSDAERVVQTLSSVSSAVCAVLDPENRCGGAAVQSSMQPRCAIDFNGDGTRENENGSKSRQVEAADEIGVPSIAVSSNATKALLESEENTDDEPDTFPRPSRIQSQTHSIRRL